jgi:glycosyltransferase involved in cell wall biosynthesis
MAHQKKLLVGPLPPGWGGARISFKLFDDYLKNNSKQEILHYDLPIRFNRDKNPPGRVNHLKTLMSVFSALFRIPFVSRVIVFCSRNFCFSYGLVLLLVSKIFRKPAYIRFFGGHPAKNSVLRLPLIGSIAARLLSIADKIIVQTYVGAEEFPKYMRNKISIIVGYRSAINPGTGIKVPQDSTVRFTYTGTISRDKGVGYLLDAFRELTEKAGTDKDIELYLYGAGDKELINKCDSLEKVFYYGRVDNSELRRNLRKYDVFIFPSQLVSEGHPGSVIEALMAGLPVIASNLSGVDEVVRHNENGLLVEPGDTRQLAEAMGAMIKDSELRKRLADRAFESSKQFDSAHVLPKLAEALGIKVSNGNS